MFAVPSSSSAWSGWNWSRGTQAFRGGSIHGGVRAARISVQVSELNASAVRIQQGRHQMRHAWNPERITQGFPASVPHSKHSQTWWCSFEDGVSGIISPQTKPGSTNHLKMDSFSFSGCGCQMLGTHFLVHTVVFFPWSNR